MKKIFIFILLIFIFKLGSSQVQTFGGKTEDNNTDWKFALRIMPNSSGGLIQTAIVKEKPEGGSEVNFIPIKNWIYEISGLETSAANPNKINLFKKYDIIIPPDDLTGEALKNYMYKKAGFIINNLWRLKYSEYPYFNPEMNHEKGWAKNPDPKITWMPSESQLQLLKTYGINNFGDFFKGDYLFDLLKNVTDRDWQSRYLQSAGVYHENSRKN